MKTTLLKPLGVSAAVVLISALMIGCSSKEEDSTSPSSSTSSSSPTSAHSHDHSDHGHQHDAEEKKIHSGEFDDAAVRDRALADWEGDWQSVYPYLQSGKLDKVLESKAKDQDKTLAEIKKYYNSGYKTDVTNIEIQGDLITFSKGDKKITGKYTYAGHKILTYSSGKKGVRYLFDLDNNVAGAPQHIQFSDHEIAPKKAAHFHLFFGDAPHEEILKEMENWATYYPAGLSADDIEHEMLHH